MSDNRDNAGCYQLILSLPLKKTITIGRLGRVAFEAGFYIYTGRARKNLHQRLERHRRKEKKLHWHIDYLLEKATLVDIKTFPGRFDECKINNDCRDSLDGAVIIDGFGSSDCRCRGHLIKVGERPQL